MRGRGLRRRAAVEQGQGQGADASVLNQPPAARRVGKGGSAAHGGACLQKSTSESCVLETSAIRK
jgi:hypothetical protein